ncbi:MAG: tRNA (adenosine(37)-N6)-threonylcarbamoyltransferase complex transferase subunit TsaD [Verrucomicrobia bacterium]|nr:tRNA (adenosine(37)-N6)-threonylcarbamoyltransferase complex transferase subunit TsaD [Verrucomicrobiota bacterium]
MPHPMLTLGIETSCDETSAAVVEGERRILSSIVASQFDLHSRYGGVVPELACRRHVEVISQTVESALDEAGVALGDIGLISVVKGPGLIGALLVGVSFAKALARSTGTPLIGVNHVEAHLYSAVMSNMPAGAGEGIEFPAVGLVVSGGHTMLFLMEDFGQYRWLGGTVDDAVGEAGDKVATLLGLPYLGGPLVENLAGGGNACAIDFPRAMMQRGNYDFSYAGLKTAVLYHVKGYAGARRDESVVTDAERADIAAAYQAAAFEPLVTKTLWAADEFAARSAVVCGGVSRNQTLRAMFTDAAADRNVRVYFPAKALCTDNAAMVAGLGAWRAARFHDEVTDDFDAFPNFETFGSFEGYRDPRKGRRKKAQ